MKVQLRLRQTSLFINETTSGVITVTNDADRVTIARDPLASSSSPVLRVTELKENTFRDFTAVSRLVACDHHYNPAVQGDPARHFKPNEVVELPIDLTQWIGTLAAGRYTVQALLVEGGQIIARSEAIDLEVRDDAFGWMQTQPPSSGIMPVWYAACTHMAADGGTTVMLRGFKFEHCAMLERSIRVAQTRRPVYPVISVPLNGMFVQGHWIGWLEDDALVCAYLGEDAVIHPPRRVKAQLSNAMLMQPLFHDRALQLGPADGMAAVLSAIDRKPVLHAVWLGADGRGVREQDIAVPEGAVVWTQTAFLSNGVRRVLWIGRFPEELRLHMVTWPIGGPMQVKAAALTWKGHFIGAAARLDPQNTLHGAVLTWTTGASALPQPTLQTWRVDAAGQATAAASTTLNWPAAVPIDACRMRVSDDGQPWGLLRRPRAGWSLFDPSGAVRVAVSGDTADIVFDEDQALIQRSDNVRGLQWSHVDATPYPVW